MLDDDGDELGPGPIRVKSIAQILLERVADQLVTEAGRKGGVLDGQQIRDVIDGFKTRSDKDAMEFYRAGWNECLAVIDEVRRESGRRMPFERLMVKPFAHLLPTAHHPVTSGQGLSRRILPGFLSALQQMLGPVLLEQYQTRCRELVRIIQTARGSDFDWEDVYTDPTSQIIVNDVLVHVSRHFSDLSRRRLWMIDVIVSNMPLGEDEVERAWSFGESEFQMLMEALFRPLRNQLASPEGELRIRERYGTLACELLGDLFRDLSASAKPIPLRRIGT